MTDENDINLLKAGDHFGDYVVERCLGKGGMGVVYLVHAPDGSPFAIKVMDSRRMTHDLRRRFAREAEFSMKIRHRNLISVYDVGEDPETELCYIIMDYVPGGTLSDRIRNQGKIPVGEAVKIIMQIATALDVAHQNGLIHRDVKPDNIMFAADGTPKLADLGVAKLDDDRRTMVTMTGMIIGTPAYMSPEQLMDSHKIDARADIYSLGVVLYEMLSGKRPNSGSTAVELLARAIKGEPLPDIRKVCPEISAAIAYVLSRMCAPKPEDRPETSIAAAQLLHKAAMGELVIPKRTPGYMTVLAAGRDARRKRILAISLVVVGLAAFLIVGLAVIGHAVSRYSAEEPDRQKPPVAKKEDAPIPEVPPLASIAAEKVSAETNAVASAPQNQSSADRRKERAGGEGRRVRSAKVDGMTWFYTLRGGEAVIWRGHLGHGDEVKPAIEPREAESVVVPSELDGYKVSSVGTLAFYRCRMKSVVVSEGIRCLGAQAFYGCSALEDVKLPLSLDIIDRNVFEKCVSLKMLDIGDCPFVTGSSFNCPNLAQLSVAKTNHEYVDRDGYILSRSLRELIFVPRTCRSASILDGVEEIGEGAFMGCSKLKKMTIPGGVKRIGALAFAFCRNLTTVEFQPGVREIDDRAFAYCPNLKRVVLPESLETVGTMLFDRCPSLQSVEFGGDAPQIDQSESLFGDASESLRILVRRGSKGWKAAGSDELPDRWPAGALDDSRKIQFADGDTTAQEN